MNTLICTSKREYFLHISVHLWCSSSSAGCVSSSHPLPTYEVFRPGWSSFLLGSEKLHSKCQVLSVAGELIHEFLLASSHNFAARYYHSYHSWVTCPCPRYLSIARAGKGEVLLWPLVLQLGNWGMEIHANRRSPEKSWEQKLLS